MPNGCVENFGVMSIFFRFPSTMHLAWLGTGMPRDDKVLSASQSADLLCGEVLVEEKLDGANLGFSLSPDGSLRAQNRGQYLQEPFGGQFTRLPAWLALHGSDVLLALAADGHNNLIFFGEWCAARHSLNYDALPDWFLLFDVYDQTQKRFWSSNRRTSLAEEIGLATTPTVFRGRCSLEFLKEILINHPSQFRNGALEGLVIRRESANWCEWRAKLVCADFTQALDEHWSRRFLEWNRTL
jgi:ATP-dependent RNA circularization protein (DNA/RNA ligase family)